MGSKFRRIAATALLVIVGLIVGSLFGEVILRIWTPAAIGQSEFRGSHKVRHHILVPHTRGILETSEFSVEYRINQDGFRDTELLPKQDGEFRIAVLGDSFVEGFGVAVESCFVECLERSLNQENPERLQYNVINCGTVSYSPLLEVIQLREQVLQVSADLVLVAFDMTDLDDDRMYSQEVTLSATGAPIAAQNTHLVTRRWNLLPSGFLRTFIRDNSYFFALLNSGLNAISPAPVRADRLRHTTENSISEWTQSVHRSFSYLRHLNLICQEKGVPMVLFTYPYAHQASSSEWLEGRKLYGIGPGRYDSFIFGELEAFAETEGISYLDMTSTFRREYGRRLYFPIDGHWTPFGHAVAADTLFAFLRNGRHL